MARERAVLQLVLAACIAGAAPVFAQPLKPNPVVECQALLRAMGASYTLGANRGHWIEGLGAQHWPRPELIPFVSNGFDLEPGHCENDRFTHVSFPSGEEVYLEILGVVSGTEVLLLFHLDRPWPVDGLSLFSAQICIKLTLSGRTKGQSERFSCGEWPLNRWRPR